MPPYLSVLFTFAPMFLHLGYKDNECSIMLLIYCVNSWDIAYWVEYEASL